MSQRHFQLFIAFHRAFQSILHVILIHVSLPSLVNQFTLLDLFGHFSCSQEPHILCRGTVSQQRGTVTVAAAGLRALHLRLPPLHLRQVEDVELVVVLLPIVATEDVDLGAHRRGRVVLRGGDLQQLEGHRAVHRPARAVAAEDLIALRSTYVTLNLLRSP